MKANNSLQKNTVSSVKAIINSDYVKNRFKEIIGEKAPAFLASVLTVSNSKAMSNIEPNSIVTASMIAATLDLPIDPNLGFSALVPYGGVAQFQIMTKGFIQLAMRTAQYETINVTEVYKDEFVNYDHLTGKLTMKSIPGGYRDQDNEEMIIGYAAYFRLINGYEKTEYWTVEKIDAHGKKFSKTFDKSFSSWQQNRPAMRSKTVLKSMLSRWGILSTAMQLATKTDQGSIKSVEGEEVEVEYVDNPDTQIEETPQKAPVEAPVEEYPVEDPDMFGLDNLWN
ncbi:MAG: recombinase RecT [Spirochaetia bacterium]|nr:recombinase RecT [Spirochaetia bacterium]